MQPLLEPRSVAVIGASADPGKPGNVLVQNIIDGGFTGSIYPVNPRAETVCGLPCHASVSDIEVQVDLAYIVVRRDFVVAAVEECIGTRVKALAILSAGFAEADDWGRAAQRRISELVADSGVIAIGPNAIGLVTMGGGHRGTFVRFDRWRSGSVAIGAQSGVFAGAIAQQEMAREVQGLGIRHSVSVGNKCGIGERELVRAFGADDAVSVIGLYLESIANAREFLAELARVKDVKPVVVLKSGRTVAGARASASHTGSLMTDDAVLEQLLSQHGALRVADEEEFVSLLKTLSMAPLPASGRVGIVTLSGAMGVIAADLLSELGLEVTPYGTPTLERLAGVLPEWQPVGNPADLWPGVERDPRGTIIGGLEAALSDPGVDQVLSVLIADPAADFPELGADLARLRERYPAKPLHLMIIGTRKAQWTAAAEGLGIPVHESLRIAVRAMSSATRYVSLRGTQPYAHVA